MDCDIFISYSGKDQRRVKPLAEALIKYGWRVWWMGDMRTGSMIDIRFVVAHGLWILGAAIILAAFSYHRWLAQEQKKSTRDVLRIAWGWKMSLSGGVLLIASGFLLMEGTRWWERGLWLLVWGGSAFDLWHTSRTN